VDNRDFRPVQSVLSFLQFLHHTYGQQLCEIPYPTLANPAGHRHFDLLTGVQQAYSKLDALPSLAANIEWEWQQKIAEHLLYP
jgi:hypothetical protein